MIILDDTMMTPPAEEPVEEGMEQGSQEGGAPAEGQPTEGGAEQA